MITTDHCLSCRLCVLNRPGRRIEHPCLEKPPRPRGRPPKPFTGLLGLLRALYTREQWRKLRGRSRPGTYARTKKAKRAPRPSRPPGDTPWRRLRHSTPRTADIITPSCRITTTAHYGPNALARNHFPPVFDAPEVTLTQEEAVAATLEDQRRRLASTANLSLGGRRKRP